MDVLVKELFALAIKVNQETEKAVWAEYVGHVNGFELRIASGKEEPAYNNKEFDEICYMESEYLDESMRILAEMKEVLCGLLPDEKEVCHELVK
jgi:hypothetical protein